MKYIQLLKQELRKLVFKLGILLNKVETDVSRSTLPDFGNKPSNLVIDKPRRIINPDDIYFGDNVYIGPGSMLNAIKTYPDPLWDLPDNIQIKSYNPKIIIGNRVISSGGLTIGALSKIEIGDDVLFASNVNITDGLHGYRNIDTPYKFQPMERISPIKIGQGCWIGQNVVILPGIKIGEMTIIGANSVVTKDLPARCVAIGAPARVIKCWDEKNSCWCEI